MPDLATSNTHATNNPAKVEFWKSLLKIEAEVAVTLATTHAPTDRVLSFVPGVMIQFEKPCDTPLTIEIDGRQVAHGEVVKVGDKFGVRILDVLERDERWIPLISESNSAPK